MPTSTPPARRRARLRVRALAVVALAILGGAVAPAAALAAGGRIAFVNFAADGTQSILAVDPDGSHRTQLTSSAAGFDSDPTWSPDGTRLAFIRKIDRNGDGRGDSNEIFIVNADGTGLRQLTDTGVQELYPDWSPDGRRIAYTRNDTGDIWALNVDGSGETQITRDSGFDYNADWSPDGTRIAFDRFVGNQYAAHVVNVDGTGLTQVTNSDEVNDEGPVWSPDGTRLAVTSYADLPTSEPSDRDEEIVVIDVATKARKALTSNLTSDSEPTWSPDGDEIAYRANPDCGSDPACDSTSEIMVIDEHDMMGPRGSVSNTPGTSDSRPDWGPSTGPADRDGDGIPDALDTSADAPSNAFSDGAGTSGSIVDAAGLTVTLEDLPAPDGVRVTVGAGSGQVTFHACGFTVRLSAGSVADLTCGSVRVNVAQGSAEIVTGDGLSVVTVPAAAGAHVINGAGGSVVESLGGAVTVTVDGVSRPVAAGTPLTVAPSASRLCRATVQYVRASVKYQALSRPARTGVDRQLDTLCAGLDAISARLKPAQKAAAITLYKKGVGALAASGWLTAAQAETLRGAADAL